MKGEWCYYRRKYSAQVCEDIIRTAKSRPGKDATMGVSGEVQDNKFRKSKIRFVYPGDPQLDFLFADIWKMALECNDEWFGFHLSKLDYLQIAEYRAETLDEYRPHQDVFWLNGDAKYHRKLSVIIQLSNPYEYDGGDFEMYGVSEQPQDKSAIKDQGTVIFFPSFITHAALPVTRGERYSIAAWINGPKFV